MLDLIPPAYPAPGKNQVQVQEQEQEQEGEGPLRGLASEPEQPAPRPLAQAPVPPPVLTPPPLSPAPLRTIAPPSPPCHIVFGNMAATEAVRVEVRAWLERLSALTAAMVVGRVAIEAVDEKRKEQRYRVTMELSMPEGVVIVGPEQSSNAPHDDVYVAVRNAFRAARRPLELYALAHPPAVAIDAAEPGPLLTPSPGVA